MRPIPTAVSITDPLVKYQALIATGLYSPDPAQHRLALHLQKIYHRLKDYSPSAEYQTKLKAITRALDQAKGQDRSGPLATPSHPIRRNPLFSRFFARTEGADTLALTRVLTSHEEAISINSPRGLFLSGEVGTGKSMLLDLLTDGLPTSRKRRWHFNTFMLHTLSQLERYRKSHVSMEGGDPQYSLLWMARELIEQSPILTLDEFQLPDRAASKILSNLFTAFFQLGGVLIASSNRVPEELEKAAGFDYASSTAAAAGGSLGRFLGLRKTRGKGELYGSSSDFAAFLEVLKARCEFWQMEGGKDWRRREAGELLNRCTSGLSDSSPYQATPAFDSTTQVPSNVNTAESNNSASVAVTPRHFHLLHEADEASWAESLDALLPVPISQVPWEPTSLIVYGRTIAIPQQHDGIVYWNFTDLVSPFGPADYISMASTFHTFIIDGIPTLTILKKNEARRLITLLDALYEARCKLVVRAEAGPDGLFFPDAKRAPDAAPSPSPSSSSPPPQAPPVVDADAIHSETIAEAYQDAQSPFRPNISSYGDEGEGDSSKHSAYDPDHDFQSDFGLGPAAQQRSQQQRDPRLDFSNTSAFTGEDERFAYKRAASRLWELCGAQWHARAGDGWWQPLPVEARHWEKRRPSASASAAAAAAATASPPEGSGEKKEKEKEEEKEKKSDVRMGPAVELDELAGLQRLRVEHLKNTAATAAKEGED